MTRIRSLQALVAGAALVAAMLVNIATAPPAAACAGDSCGDLGLHIENFSPSAPYVYGRAFSFYVEAEDNSQSCHLAAILCSSPTGDVDLLVDGFYPAVASDALAYACAGGGTGNCKISRTGTFRTAAFPAGHREIVVAYRPSGSEPFDPDETRAPIHILQAATTLDVTAPATAIAGAPVTLSGTVRPTSPVDLANGARLPEGFVRFTDETVSPAADLGSALIDSEGRATLTTQLPHAGSSSIVARYRGDGNYTGSDDAATITTQQGTVAVAVSQSAATTVYGEAFDITATVTPTPPATLAPTGSVALRSDGATITTPAANLPVGVHSIDAVYAGDGAYAGRTSDPIMHTVSKASTGVVLNSPTPNPSTLGQPVVLQATVLVTAPGAGTPTGTVQFRDGATLLGAPVPLNNQVANLATTALGGGSHSITAVYSGDTNFNGNTSNTLSRTVTCNTTITGTAGNVAVPASGTTCITNANISGGVSIPAGAKVSIVNSTIGGYLTANGGAATLVVCGSTLGGITVAGAAGAVTIGDPANACSANQVKGSIQASSNTGGVTIGGNKVTGWIQCSGNSPAPTNGGRANTAGGRTGQCATPANF